LAKTLKSSVWLYSGRYEHEKGYESDKTLVPRPMSSIGYVVCGDMDFILGDRRISLTAGDIYYVPRLASYIIKCYSDTVFTTVHFNFHSNKENVSFRNADIQRLLPDGDIYDAIDYIHENIIRKKNSFEVLSRFYQLAEKVSKCLVKRSPKPIDERILNALSVLESKQGRELSIDETAVLCHMSTSHFYAIFKKEMGCTPVEYKNRAAIDYAVQLLFENPHLSIDRLSEKAGFESASYFRRVFKTYTGVSPREYRRRVILDDRQ